MKIAAANERVLLNIVECVAAKILVILRAGYLVFVKDA